MAGAADGLAALLTPEAVRHRAHALLALAEADHLEHFRLAADPLAGAADLVVETTRATYPGLAVPLHSRWRHFEIAGRDLWAETAAPVADAVDERARARFELAMVSVLLDAGAGPAWRYRDPGTGLTLERSEGLAVASLRAFAAGAFSSAPASQPRRADAAVLSALEAGALAGHFQVHAENPLPGLDGRARLLRGLGDAVAARPEVFAVAGAPRPGGLYDHLKGCAAAGAVPARHILVAILGALNGIWPSGLRLGGVALGDVGRHSRLRMDDASDGLVPFHKLSQWLAYSLVEPLAEAGIEVTGLDALTGLAEYRNGGLLMDSGVLALRHPGQAEATHAADSELVVEWRALTVALLDRLAETVRRRLGTSAEAMPLAAVLQGGTWAAGRRLAMQLRNGRPPLDIAGDGTVF